MNRQRLEAKMKTQKKIMQEQEQDEEVVWLGWKNFGMRS